MAALKKLAAATARVLRDGAAIEVPAAELVPGDVVLLEAGNVVPADLRLVERMVLKIEEAALTGESVPVEKRTEPVAEADLAARRSPQHGLQGARSSTYGRGRGHRRGHRHGRPSSARSRRCSRTTSEVKTPLQKRLGEFGQQARDRRARHLRGGVRLRRAARRAGRAHVPHRGEPRRGGDPRGAAGGGHHLARARRAQDGEAERADPAPAGGGGARARSPTSAPTRPAR